MTENSYIVESDYVHFSPEACLIEYYAEMGDENRFLMDFHAWCSHFIASECPDGQNLALADIGGGPTIYQLISTARLVEDIHFYEHGEANRRRVEYWLRETGDLFWDAYFFEGLARENHYQNGHGSNAPVTSLAVEQRKAQLPAKLTRCAPCDLLHHAALGQNEVPPADYGIVSSAFCVEAISDDRDIFMRGMDNITSLCAKGGYLMLTMVKNCSYYPAGNRFFPAYPVDENIMKEVLESRGFDVIKIATAEAEPLDRGYEGLLGILARQTRSLGGLVTTIEKP